MSKSGDKLLLAMLIKTAAPVRAVSYAPPLNAAGGKVTTAVSNAANLTPVQNLTRRATQIAKSIPGQNIKARSVPTTPVPPQRDFSSIPPPKTLATPSAPSPLKAPHMPGTSGFSANSLKHGGIRPPRVNNQARAMVPKVPSAVKSAPVLRPPSPRGAK